MSKSCRLYVLLVLILACCSGLSLLLPQGEYAAASIPPLPIAMMVPAVFLLIFVSYGALGSIGLFLGPKVGIPDLLDPAVTSRERYLRPLSVGALLGLVLIVADVVFARFNTIGRFVHPPFPTSIVASVAAGIGEEIIFRLFFISFWTWLISKILLGGRYLAPVFWAVSFASALAFSASHYPVLFVLYGFPSISAVPFPVHLEVFLLNGLVALAAAYYFRKSGYLAAVGVHLWTDVVWHVI